MQCSLLGLCAASKNHHLSHSRTRLLLHALKQLRTQRAEPEGSRDAPLTSVSRHESGVFLKRVPASTAVLSQWSRELHSSGLSHSASAYPRSCGIRRTWNIVKQTNNVSRLLQGVQISLQTPGKTAWDIFAERRRFITLVAWFYASSWCSTITNRGAVTQIRNNCHHGKERVGLIRMWVRDLAKPGPWDRHNFDEV